MFIIVYSNSPPTREKIRADDNVRLRSTEQHRSNSSLSQTSSSGWDQTDSTGIYSVVEFIVY